MNSLKSRIERHRQYWNREDTGGPLVTVTLAEDFFFSTHYQAARPLLQPGKVITPDMLDVSAFMADYEHMYQESLLVEQDGFWVGTPFTGIPWMEAILGCKIRAMDSSFVSEPIGTTIENQEDIELVPDNPWLAKYLEFTTALSDLSDNRFPVGEPIMRGPSDMLGSILGQEAMVYAMVYAMVLHPEKSFKLLCQVTEMEGLKVIEVNKDVGGPSISEMMELFKKIVDRKNLIIWGDLDEKDLEHIQNGLPSRGVYIHIVTENVSRANTLLRTISRSD